MVGIGEPLRSDDGAGPRVVHELKGRLAPDVRVVERLADPTQLLELWRGCELAIVVDAMRSGAELGTVRRLDADELDDAPDASLASSHGFSLRETLALGAALGRRPDRLVLVLIEAGEFRRGAAVTPAVARGIREAARQVTAELARASEPVAPGR